ncbi:hypothetical protein B0H63DRAFT_61530 [Podospora didyma]|uniref:GPI anchored serine-threonine rich protein n=1 Tax=Podospora didyma TaxID=330526 RepID=A0AAE0P7Q9_9PEZI|nr:hypothetical protein B0H63DRAFT_61530 [Podospora didyma]
MKFFLLPLALFASAAVAQTSACAADYIVDTCLLNEKAKFDACPGGDYDCQCAAYQNIVTCYNNCPNDPEKFSADGQRQIFCGYASQYPSKTIKASVPTSTASTPAGKTTIAAQQTKAAEAATGSASGNGTPTDSAAQTTKSNNAGDLALNAGGLLAAVAGVVAAVL